MDGGCWIFFLYDDAVGGGDCMGAEEWTRASGKDVVGWDHG